MKWLVLAAGLCLNLGFSVKALASSLSDLPYGRKIDLALLKEAAQKPSLQEIITFVQSKNVSVYKLTPENASRDRAKEKREIMALKEIPKNLRQNYMIQDPDNEVRGLTISKHAPCCNLKTEVIALTPEASSYDLLHEFAHVLFERGMSDKEALAALRANESQANIERSFDFNFQKLYEDMAKAQDELWRKDILRYTTDYFNGCEMVFKYRLGEEVLVEYLIVKILKEMKSPHLASDDIQHAAQYMKSNLGRIKTRLENMNFVAPWIANDIYGDGSGFDISLPEKLQARKKMKALEDQLKAMVPPVEKLYELQKEISNL